MKTKQELDEIKEKCFDLGSKLNELTKEELNLVTGGQHTYDKDPIIKIMSSLEFNNFKKFTSDDLRFIGLDDEFPNITCK